MIIIEQLHWAGHTSRVEDTSILQQLVCCGLEEAVFNQDRQMNNSKDTLKYNFKQEKLLRWQTGEIGTPDFGLKRLC